MESTPVNFYVALGLRIEDHATLTQDAINEGYRRASRTAHPDLGGSHEAMLAVQAAGNILGNPILRDIWHSQFTGLTPGLIPIPDDQFASLWAEASLEVKNLTKHGLTSVPWEVVEKGNFLAIAGKMIDEAEKGQRHNYEAVPSALKCLDALRKRIAYTGEGASLLQEALDELQADAEKSLEAAKRASQRFRLMRQILAQHWDKGMAGMGPLRLAGGTGAPKLYVPPGRT